MTPTTQFALDACLLMARAKRDNDALLIRVAREQLRAVAAMDWDGRICERIVGGEA